MNEIEIDNLTREAVTAALAVIDERLEKEISTSSGPLGDLVAHKLHKAIEDALTQYIAERATPADVGHPDSQLLPVDFQSGGGKSGLGDSAGLYVVMGRIPGDDDDEMHVIEAPSDDVARLAFELVMYNELDEDRESIHKQYGDTIIYTGSYRLTPDTIEKALPEAELRQALSWDGFMSDEAPKP